MHVVSLEGVQDCSKLPDHQFGNKTPLISRSSFGKTFRFNIRLSLDTYRNRRTAKSVVGRQQSLPFRTRHCPRDKSTVQTSFEANISYVISGPVTLGYDQHIIACPR